MADTIGIGVDLVDVQVLADALQRTPALAARLFRSSELGRPIESMAGRFAAKEALAKALGGGDLPWTDVEVVSTPSGAPRVRLDGMVGARARELGVTRVHLSVTHDGGFAVAAVVLEGRTPSGEEPIRRTREVE